MALSATINTTLKQIWKNLVWYRKKSKLWNIYDYESNIIVETESHLYSFLLFYGFL